MLYAARDSKSLFYLDELEELIRSNQNLKLVTKIGYLDYKSIRNCINISDDTLFYVSGSSEMIDATILALDTLHVLRSKIYFEEWSKICFQQMLGSLLPEHPDGVIVTDLSGCIRYCNHAWETITGWKTEEVIGKFTPRIIKTENYQMNFIKIYGNKNF